MIDEFKARLAALRAERAHREREINIELAHRVGREEMLAEVIGRLEAAGAPAAAPDPAPPDEERVA